MAQVAQWPIVRPRSKASQDPWSSTSQETLRSDNPEDQLLSKVPKQAQVIQLTPLANRLYAD